MKNNTLLLSAFLLSGLLIGCAQPPQQELTTAQAALSAADSAEADVYVADLYTAAQDSFTAAQAEIELQNGKSSFSRDYDRANGLIAYTIETATAAQGQVETRKETMRVEADGLIAQAQAAVAEAKALIAQTPAGRTPNVALVALQQHAGDAETTLNDAVAAQAAGDVVTAHGLAASAVEKANALLQQLQAPAQTGSPIS